jgi:hypothetical protein
MAQIGRNDPCPCGSKAKYKRCCLPLDQGRTDRLDAARSAKSLREKDLTLLAAASDIFGLSRPWEKVKAGFSNAQIREFYTVIANLWQPDTNLESILPEPDSTLRALYLGEYEPELMLENVFRFCLYTDQILLTNPFPNPNLVAEKYNPISHPDEWRLQTLKLVFHLVLLAPWIDAGLVVLIPDPGDFNRELRVKTWNLAGARLKGWKPSDQDVDASMLKRRMRRMLLLLSPRDYLERTVREVDPDLPDDKIRSLLDSIEQERISDPLVLNETLDRMSGQMEMSHFGANLEMGMYICQATGAFPYTNLKFRWKEILNAREELDPTAQVWSPLTNAFQQLQFKFLDKVDSKFACSIRQDGRLEGFRSYLRKIWNTVGGEPDLGKSESLARDFRDELTQTYNDAEAEWSAIDRDLLKWGVPTIGGAVAMGHMSLGLPTAGFVLAGISELVQAAMKRRAFRKRVPMSVFIDLANR